MWNAKCPSLIPLCGWLQAARVRVLAAPIPEQRLAVWVGGSILGSLPGFHEMWVNRAEYLEHGTTVVERKCP